MRVCWKGIVQLGCSTDDSQCPSLRRTRLTIAAGRQEVALGVLISVAAERAQRPRQAVGEGTRGTSGQRQPTGRPSLLPRSGWIIGPRERASQVFFRAHREVDTKDPPVRNRVGTVLDAGGGRSGDREVGERGRRDAAGPRGDVKRRRRVRDDVGADVGGTGGAAEPYTVEAGRGDSRKPDVAFDVRVTNEPVGEVEACGVEGLVEVNPASLEDGIVEAVNRDRGIKLRRES